MTFWTPFFFLRPYSQSFQYLLNLQHSVPNIFCALSLSQLLLVIAERSVVKLKNDKIGNVSRILSCFLLLFFYSIEICCFKSFSICTIQVQICFVGLDWPYCGGIVFKHSFFPHLVARILRLYYLYIEIYNIYINIKLDIYTAILTSH